MKRMIITSGFIVLLLSIVSFGVVGQDIHFSQFNSAPVLLNPALAGVNGGNYRFAANYKSQWSNLASYNTIAASYDMSLFRTSPKSNFGGIGVSFFSDQAGDLSLRTTQVNLSLSYTFLLNRSGKQTLSSGIVAGVGHRSIDYTKAQFDSQFGVGGFDPNRSSFENLSNNTKVYADLGAGFLWNLNKNENTNYYIGAAVAHLNQPNYSFLGERDDQLFLKFSIHGGGHFGISKQVSIMPSFLFVNQGPHREFNVGALVKLKKTILENNKTSFYIGGWYRVLDAVIITTRVDIGSVNIGFSYDVNLSGLTPASNFNGGPELSLIYTGFFPSKKTQVRHCPTL